MYKDFKGALEKIVGLCEKTTYPTKRIESIMDIALQALGLTENQRELQIRIMRETALQKQHDIRLKKQIKEKEREDDK
jgi:hypothetical protein